MAASSYPTALARVLTYEGGYVDHPADPGGATNLGVTIGTLSAWLGRPATKAEVRALTKASVAPIYRQRYWDRVKGDQLPAGVDLAVFDFAVNSGPDRAVKFLQSVCGVKQDGVIGLATLAAVKRRGSSAVIRELCAARLAWLERLPTWRTFGKGWGFRVMSVLAESLALATAAAKDVPPEPVVAAVAVPKPQTPIPVPTPPTIPEIARAEAAKPAPVQRPATFAQPQPSLWQRFVSLFT